jgi:hypothetical protein
VTPHIRGIDSPRDVGARAGIRQGVIAGIAPKRLKGCGLHAPVLDESLEKVLSDVAAPERAVAVGGDDPPRLGECEGFDAPPHVIRGLQLHGASITDRTRPGFD